MKHTLIIAGTFALFSFASCNNANTESSTTTKTDSTATKTESKTERNINSIKASMDGINSHDINKVFKDTGNHDFVEYGDGSMPPLKNDSAKKSLADFMNAFPDMKIESAQYFADGNTVVVVDDWNMTFKNDLGPIKATGKSIKYKDVDIFTFDDNGKLLSHRNIYPNGAIFMQVGVDMSKMQAGGDKGAKKEGDKKK